MKTSEPISKKVLVTGASGFVGKRVCTDLLNRGFLVKGVSRHLMPQADRFEPVRISDLFKADWQAIMSDCDFVIHLAAMAHQTSPEPKVSDEEYFRINAEGTLQLCECIRKTPKVRRLVFVSSIGAITLNSDSPVDESSPCEPLTHYGKSKLRAEKFICDILFKSSADWCVLRPPLVYGAGNPGNMERLVRLVQTGLPLPFGALRCRRNFIFVGNLSDAIILSLDHERVSRQIYCIADEEIMSLPELICLLSEVVGSRAKLIPMPVFMLRLLGKFGDMFYCLTGRSSGFDSYSIERLLGNLVVCSDRFRKDVDWRQPYMMKESLKETLA